MNTDYNISNQGHRKEDNYITYPRNFVTYKWGRPILVLILFIIFYLIMGGLLVAAVGISDANAFSSLGVNTYDAMDVTTVSGVLTSIGGVAVMLPALALAVFITRERPFSSYASARGGWNYRIFFLSILVAGIIYAVFYIIQFFAGVLNPFDNHFTVAGFILLTLIGPIQCVAEEYVFRGWLLQTVGSWTRLPVFAVIIQCLIFVALHPYNLTGRITVGVSALIFSLCAWAGRGLEVSGGLHVVNNMFAFYMSGFGLEPIRSAVSIKDMIASAGMGIIFLVVMLVIIQKCSWFHQSKKDDIKAFEEKMAARALAKGAMKRR